MNALPAVAPIASTVVPGSCAVASRNVAGGTCTSVPTGASNVSSTTVKAARAAHDDVQLLGPVGLAVRLDHVVTCRLADPDVDAERVEADPPAQRPQHLRPLRWSCSGRGRRSRGSRSRRRRSSRAQLLAARPDRAARRRRRAPRGSPCPPRRRAPWRGRRRSRARPSRSPSSARSASSTSTQSSRGVLPKSRSWAPYSRASSATGCAWSSTRRSTRTSLRRGVAAVALDDEQRGRLLAAPVAARRLRGGEALEQPLARAACPPSR